MRSSLSSTGALDMDSLPRACNNWRRLHRSRTGLRPYKLGTEVTVIEGMENILAVMDKEIVEAIGSMA